MSSDVISLLQLDKGSTSKFIVVKEINRCESSFITSCILNHCIKNKIGVLVVTTHNSLQHFQNVGLRMNYNLQRYVDIGLIDFFNFGEFCVNNLLVKNVLPDMYLEVRERVLALKQKYDKVSVIIDGISHMFDLNYSLAQVNDVLIKLCELVFSCTNSFIVCHCNEANQDDVTGIMSNLLSHKAHVVFEVENLPSGLSADVSGHLNIRYPGLKYNDDHVKILDIKPSRYLFKLFDRGVKLFAPGTV